MALLIQPSFAKGELSPALHGRVDIAAYRVGLRTARNVFIRAYGGAENRAGLQFICPVADHTHTPRLFEFQFKTTDTYILEFGDFYMRVVRNGALVTEADKTITGITQASPAVVTSAAHGFSNGDQVYVSGVVGMTRVNGRWFTVAGVTTDTFQLTDQVTGANIDSTAYGAYTSGGIVARVYKTSTPYAIADLAKLKFVQSADVMTLTHPSYPIYELSRTSHTSWSFTQPTFAPAQAYPTSVSASVTGTAGTTTVRYRVTASATDTQEESLPGLGSQAGAGITNITRANPAVVSITGHGLSNGDEIEINGVVGMTEVNGVRFTVANAATNTFELEGIDSTGYGAYTSGGTANRTFVELTTSNATFDNTISWTAASGAKTYSVYRRDNGLYAFIGNTELTSFEDKNIGSDLNTTPPAARNPFKLAGDYPGTVSYYEQRRVFGGSSNEPDTEFYSQTGSSDNFSYSTPSQANDAITVTLAALQVNEIRHFVPGNDLIVLTSGSEWRVNAGTNSGFAADTLTQKPQSYWGCSHIRPLVIGNEILFVDDTNARVRSLGYSLQIDGYTGDDVTLLGSHLLHTNTIVDWAYARVPDPTIFTVRDDGQLLTLTYQSKQEVVAWAHSDTDGWFEQVASLHHQITDVDDEVYFVVRRIVNGNTVRYIEKLHSRRFKDVRDCFFVDGGLSYDNPVTISNVTSADPIVITATAHGFSNGDEIDLFDITWQATVDGFDNETQPDQLNKRRYYVTSATTNTFEIAETSGGAAVNASDTTLFPNGFSAYVEGGTARKTVGTVSGLDHLEGKDVAVLADGNVVSGLSVANGAVTLPRNFSRIHVGLKYIADVETLNIETPGAGTIQGAMKKVNAVTVRFQDSRGLFIGPTNVDLEEMKQREFEAMGDPTDLLTGDKQVVLDSQWNTNGRIFMRQRYPLPFTVLAVVPDLEVGS